MNRSILIVICDFLLVSLVAFSNFESMVEERPEKKPEVAPQGNETGGRQDVANVLKLALEDEKRNREQLAQELSRTRESTRTKEDVIAEREQKIQEFQETLRQTEAQARQLERERAALQTQVANTRTNLQSAQTALTATRSEARASQERIEALQTELKQREQEKQALEQKLTSVERVHQAVVAEKQQLDTKLKVTEAEKRVTAEELAVSRVEKARLQESTTKLAEGVSSLADKSGALTQEIRENRPLAPNSVFHEFTQNRVETQFDGVRAGTLGPVKRDKRSQTILVSDGTNTFAIYHVADTPLTLWPPGTDWHSLTGIISRGLTSYAIPRLSFLAQDPRVVVVPVAPAQAKLLGAKIYRIAPDPFKFQEAILVGADEGYYGECKFQIDLTTPQYVKMDRSVFRGLFGKFNPSRGDLVLSKTGEVLGIMVNNEYCAVLGRVTPSVTIQCGDTLKAQQAGQMLTQLHSKLLQLPLKLQ